jgi:hypothetical protein
MDWVFAAFLAVSLLHMGEEYIYPGSFMDLMKRLNPRFAPRVTVRFAVIINSLQLLLCIVDRCDTAGYTDLAVPMLKRWLSLTERRC